MALLIAITYHDQSLTYTVTNPGEEIYVLRMQGSPTSKTEYIPEKIVIRRKGKIWVSDADGCPELIGLLTTELLHFNTKTQAA